MSTLRKFLDAVDARIGHRKLLHLALDEPIPGGASWAYVFGSAAAVLLGVQLVTGIVLAAYYSPSSTDAWASIAYLEREITMGAVVRGIHHHAAGGMVIIVGLHALQTALFGAYKAPREANWLSGLALLGLVLAFALTGYLLPWDQTGYWATKVATGIAGTVPIAGAAIQRFVQGGNDYGNLTLTRFYSLHVIVLPLLTFGLVAAHVLLFRKHGITPRPRRSDDERTERAEKFWPKQVAFDAAASAVAVSAIVLVAVTRGAPLEAPADPASNFIARPEWYFLFLFQLLKYTDGPLQIVGTVIIPGLATASLAALPFVDRAPSRLFSARKPFLGALLAGAAAVGLLTALAIFEDRKSPALRDQSRRAAREADRARELAKDGVPAQGAAFMMVHDPLTRGERVFRRECLSCHRFEGEGPDRPKAPDLTAYRSKAWIRQAIRNPDSPRLFGATKVEGMKSFAHLAAGDIDRLADLVYTRRDEGAPAVQATPAAALVEEHECGNCHEFAEFGALEGPTLYGYLSRGWVAAVVADPGRDHFYGSANTMPAFEKRLSQEDRDAVVAFLLDLENRPEPSGQWPFADDPGPIPTPRAKTATTAEN